MGLFKRIYLKLELSDRSTSIRAIISEYTPANLAKLSLLLLVTSTWFRWPYIFRNSECSHSQSLLDSTKLKSEIQQPFY